jgi:hypothetical protein
MATARARFVAVATAALGSKKAAEALADSLGLIPSPKPTITLNKQQAERDLASFNAKANNAARDRVVWFTVKQAGSLGAIGQREHGGPVTAGHAYLVGERRAEVFVPDRDGRILPSVEQFTRGTSRASAPMDEDRLVRAFASALASATLQIDDRRARFVGVRSRSG